MLNHLSLDLQKTPQFLLLVAVLSSLFLSDSSSAVVDEPSILAVYKSPNQALFNAWLTGNAYGGYSSRFIQRAHAF
jgi:hypothetical protein